MKRYLPLLILTSLLSFSIGALLPPLFAAPVNASYLPAVQGGAPAETALIYECQCGAVIATTLPDGRVLLTILDHSRGGAVVVGIDNGGLFSEIEDTPMAPAAQLPAPAFQFPGEKQGVGSSVVAFGGLVTYAPNRTEEGGRYNIWRFVYPMP